MITFNYAKLKHLKWDSEIIGYIASINRHTGKHELYEKLKPDEIRTFIDIAMVQSALSTTEIEGRTLGVSRVRQIINYVTEPKNLQEQIIAGYRDALRVIHDNYEEIQLKPNYLSQLHKVLLTFVADEDAEQIKNTYFSFPSSLELANPEGHPTPLNPLETKFNLSKICDEFNLATEDQYIDPLIAIPVFLFDFLYLQPFSCANDEMSRLLALLLMLRSGFYIGKYVPIESIIYKTKGQYINSILTSYASLEEGSEVPIPFIKYFLKTILSAYEEFDQRFEIVSEKLPTIDMVRKAANQMNGRFTKQDIMDRCPSISKSAVEIALRGLVESMFLIREGQGKATTYQKIM